MSTSSSSTLRDDSSSASTDSSHTVQPSPTQSFLEVIAEISPEPLLLVNLEHTTPSSDTVDDAVNEQLVNELQRGMEHRELDHSEELGTLEDSGVLESGSSGGEESSEADFTAQYIGDVHSDDGDNNVEEDEDELDCDPEEDDGEEETGEEESSEDDDSTKSEIDAYDEDDLEEPTDIFAFSSSFAEHAARMNKQHRDAWKTFYPDDPSDDSADDEMNLERIEDILFLAECRLRDQEKSLRLLKTSEANVPSTQTTAESRLPKPYMRSSDKIARPDSKVLVDPKMRALADKPRIISESIPVKKTTKKRAPPAGLSTHFGMPRTKITPELKRDLQLLSMRAVLDSKRMYKRQGKFKIPEYSQVGTIIEGPTDFFGGRLNRKDRNESFVGEVLKAEFQTGRFKRKYDELQSKKASGKKGSYKAKIAKKRKY